MAACKKCRSIKKLNNDGLCKRCELRLLIRKQNKEIEDWLLNYNSHKKEYELSRQEVEAGLKEVDENVGGGRASTPGRPTEALACNIITHEQSDAAKWLCVVDDVSQALGEKKRFLLEVRREGKYIISNGRPNWTSYAQARFAEEMDRAPAENLLIDMWREIVDYTARVAMARGCEL